MHQLLTVELYTSNAFRKLVVICAYYCEVRQLQPLSMVLEHGSDWLIGFRFVIVKSMLDTLFTAKPKLIILHTVARQEVQSFHNRSWLQQHRLTVTVTEGRPATYKC